MLSRISTFHRLLVIQNQIHSNLITDKDCIYVGDSYENDVIGAKNANWKCIWLNKKGLKAMDIKPDYEVNDEEALLNLISKIVKEYAQKM